MLARWCALRAILRLVTVRRRLVPGTAERCEPGRCDARRQNVERLDGGPPELAGRAMEAGNIARNSQAPGVGNQLLECRVFTSVRATSDLELQFTARDALEQGEVEHG